METVWSNTDRETGFFSSDERRWITQIHKLKEKFPDEVTILAEPEKNDGCICAKLPYDWLKIGPKKRFNLTDEEKAVRIERLKSPQKSTNDLGVDEQPEFEEDDDDDDGGEAEDPQGDHGARPEALGRVEGGEEE